MKKYWTPLVIVFVGIILLVLTHMCIHSWVDSTMGKDEYDLRIELTKVALIVIGIAFAVWRLMAIERQIETQQTGNTSQRFHQAVGHLESEREAVRVGAVYTLNELADKKEHLKNIARIFTLHLREQGEKQKYKGGNIKPISEDMQAILDIFFKREKKGYEKYSVKENFDRFKLKVVKLQSANLEEAYMQGICLRGFNLSFANLRGARLDDANLQGAILSNTDLRGVHLNGANLQGAGFYQADLRGVHLNGANLQGADFSRTDLRGACLDKTAMYHNTSFPEALLSHHPLYVIGYYIHVRNQDVKDMNQWKKILPPERYIYTDKKKQLKEDLELVCSHDTTDIGAYEFIKKLREDKEKAKVKMKKNKSGDDLLEPMSARNLRNYSSGLPPPDVSNAFGGEDVITD